MPITERQVYPQESPAIVGGNRLDNHPDKAPIRPLDKMISTPSTASGSRSSSRHADLNQSSTSTTPETSSLPSPTEQSGGNSDTTESAAEEQAGDDTESWATKRFKQARKDLIKRYREMIFESEDKDGTSAAAKAKRNGWQAIINMLIAKDNPPETYDDSDSS